MVKELVKKACRRSLQHFGYAIVHHRPEPTIKVTEADNATARAFLSKVTPAIAHNAATGTWPTPADMERYFSPERIATTAKLISICNDAGIDFNHKKILDFGCHAGFLLYVIRGHFMNAALFGCDIADDKIAMARASCPDAAIFKATIFDINAFQEFDIVFLTQVLEHLVDPQQALEKLVDVKSRDGSLVVTVPNGRLDQFPAKNFNRKLQSYAGHINFWSPESWSLFLHKTLPKQAVKTGFIGERNLYAIIE